MGARTFASLLKLYGSAEAAIEAIPELVRKSGKIKLRTLAEAEKEYAAIQKFGGQLILKEDAAYPPLLAAAEDAPPLITVKGNIGLLTKTCIGIVGARNASLAGMKIAGQIAEGLGKEGVVTVSGLARGIDTAAHKASLATGTIAVIAGGINSTYPPENKALQEKIYEQGLVIAELAFGAAPKAEHFPQRNRIISGLSYGVAVIEASLRSGSLITARLALEQGREVFAVPGSPLDPRAEGPNRLLKQGATLIECAQDILNQLPGEREANHRKNMREAEAPTYHATPLPDTASVSEIRTQLLQMLSSAPTPVDTLLAAFQAPSGALQMALLELELNGDVERLPGNRLVRAG